MDYSQQFRDLFAPADWGIPVSAQFELRDDLPPVELIAHIKILRHSL